MTILKHKRKYTITDEQRVAMRARMLYAREQRKIKSSPVLESSSVVVQERVRPPEVQAVLDSMTPERRAKLEMVQARMLSTPEGQEALARHEAEKAATQISTVAPQGQRIGSRELSLIVKTDGTMVSQYGPCVCGAPKRQWHKVCLGVKKGDNHGTEESG